MTLQVDASKVGLGAVFIQKDSQGSSRSVAFASKSLNPAETRYTNIEHEMLAVVSACMMIHHYLYGREFICQSDHKPLENIHLKHLSNAPPRLQMLLLKIQPYNFVIKYVPDKDMSMADALSRINSYGKAEIKDLDVTIYEVTPQLSRIQVESIQRATQQTKHFCYLFNRCWKVGLNLEILRQFWQWRADLSIEH